MNEEQTLNISMGNVPLQEVSLFVSEAESTEVKEMLFHFSIQLHIMKGHSNPSQLSMAFSFWMTQANIMQQP